MSEVAVALMNKGSYVLNARSLADGDLRPLLESHGASVRVGTKLSDWRYELERADAIFVNTIMLHAELLEIRQMHLTAPLIWCIHESDTRTLFKQMPRLAVNAPLALRAADSVVFVSDAQYSEYKEVLKAHDGGDDHGRFVRIYNGVNTSVEHYREEANRDTVRAELGIADEVTVLVTVGTPKRRKGQAGILAPMAQMVGQGHDVHLLIVGAMTRSGGRATYEDEITSLAKELGLSDRVTLVRRGDQQHVFRHLLAADVYVCNSVVESFPLGILEAMLVELPVVATAINGIVEQVVDGQTGFLYTPSAVCDEDEGARDNGSAEEGEEGSCGASIAKAKDGNKQNWIAGSLGE
jgi:glycosyltransferase involved in cell wall biosynthesis